MSRNFKGSKSVAKSEFYLNSIIKVLNNIIDGVLQIFLVGLNMSTVKIGLKKC